MTTTSIPAQEERLDLFRWILWFPSVPELENLVYNQLEECLVAAEELR